MCTAFVKNGKSPIVGFNLDILDMQHRVNAGPRGVFIEIFDAANGWLPMFGVNCRGGFVAMPPAPPMMRAATRAAPASLRKFLAPEALWPVQ